MDKRNNVVSLKGHPLTLMGKEIRKGDQAPDFEVLDQSFTARKLSEFQGKLKIISVFPSIDTSVCSAQTRRFDKAASELKDVVVLGISNDLPFALKRYCGAEGIENLIPLSDHKNLDFGMKYGFLIEEMRLLTRGVVVIDRDNIVQHVEYAPDFGQEPDYDKALGVVRSLL
jgi:thioredoxin-dependent peroxiredoxin